MSSSHNLLIIHSPHLAKIFTTARMFKTLRGFIVLEMGQSCAWRIVKEEI
jgi:hypothetical protein